MSVGRKREPRFRVGERVVFLYGPQKVAGKVIEDRGPLGVYGRRLYRVRFNTGQEDEAAFEVPEEDLEAEAQSTHLQDAPGLRQEFEVKYVREEKSNHWRATTGRGLFYRDVRAKGAVGYTTGRWEGEEAQDERQAIVSVFVECAPAEADAHGRVRASAWPVMTAKARALADVMFKARHPNASILHVD